MSDYAVKLSSIAEKKKKLLEEESKLIEKRKKEIAAYAEKFGLLTTSDNFIAGLFLEAQTAIREKSEKIKHWESQGDKSLKPKRADSKTAQESAE